MTTTRVLPDMIINPFFISVFFLLFTFPNNPFFGMILRLFGDIAFFQYGLFFVRLDY